MPVELLAGHPEYHTSRKFQIVPTRDLPETSGPHRSPGTIRKLPEGPGRL